MIFSQEIANFIISPILDLINGESLMHLVETTKTDDYLQEYGIRLRPGHYTFQTQASGGGKIEYRYFRRITFWLSVLPRIHSSATILSLMSSFPQYLLYIN